MASLMEQLARKREELTRVSKDQTRDRSAPLINPSAKLMCMPLSSTSDLNGRARVDEMVKTCGQLPTSLTDRAVVVWVVRHAERPDEAGGQELLARQRNLESTLAMQCGSEYKGDLLDPPLTQRGYEQARVAGKILASRGVSVDTIFASPTLRTSETGAQIAISLLDSHTCSTMSLQRVTGLSRCTSIGTFMAPEHLKILVGDQRVCIPTLDNNSDTFLATVERLATSAAASGEEGKTHPELAIVTHREGLWELLSAAGMTSLPYMPPYACICQLLFIPPTIDTSDGQGQERENRTGWFIASSGFDVGFCVADGDQELSWECCNCCGSEGTSTTRIWSIGPSNVCCVACGQRRPWHCRVPDDTSPGDATNTSI